MERNASYRLNPYQNYSNPAYLRTVERYMKQTQIERKKVISGGVPYLQEDGQNQGGYSCSLRSVTEWEDYRKKILFEHPNYFSRYMDTKVEMDGKIYTHWREMGFIPTYQKTQELKFGEHSLTGLNHLNRTFIYTNQGFRKDGIWEKTGEEWTKGLCIIEFKRVCQSGEQSLDLESGDIGLMVQDTDLVSDKN